MKKILIVGAGISGCSIARILAETGEYKIEIIDKRNHIGGNIYDEYFENSNIKYHKYGPHFFHTKNEEIFNFLSGFTDWIEYKHKVKAQLSSGEYVTLPVNKKTASIVGKENIVDIFYRPYTLKMWNKQIEELDKDILNRVKIRDDDNEFYFPDDVYQYMPKNGYTSMIKEMINHNNISIKLETSFKKEMEDKYDYVFNSMSIDEYYDYSFGKLEYRSIKFHNIVVPMSCVLPSATVNFTNNSPYTRITEWKKIPNHGENENLSVLTYEEPCSFEENNFEKFYPVKDIDNKNKNMYIKYTEIENKKNIFIGRCGLYEYLDMDKAVEKAIKIVEDFLRK